MSGFATGAPPVRRQRHEPVAPRARTNAGEQDPHRETNNSRELNVRLGLDDLTTAVALALQGGTLDLRAAFPKLPQHALFKIGRLSSLSGTDLAWRRGCGCRLFLGPRTVRAHIWSGRQPDPSRDVTGAGDHDHTGARDVIARLWRGWTTRENAGTYEGLLRTEILPGIAAREIPGYHGAHLLRTDRESEVEFLTILWFDSLDAVRAFQGEDYSRAYVPDRARAVLERFDRRSAHYHVVEQPGALRP